MKSVRRGFAMLIVLLVALLGTAQAAQANPYGPQYQNGATGKCLDLWNLDPDWNGPIQQWTCLNNKNQAWKDADPTAGIVVLRNPATGMCISAMWGPFQPVATDFCNISDPAQRWSVSTVRLHGTTMFQFRSLDFDQCLDQFGPSPDDGARVGVWDCSTQTNQLWY